MTHDDTNTSSLTLEALLAAHAASTPAEKERDLAYADAADLGLHAQQLADDCLAHGDLTNARRWYQVAAHYDIPGAADALNDVETLIDVATTVETSTDDPHDARTNDNDSAQITVLDDLSAAASLVQRAHEHAAQVENRAHAVLDDARTQAAQILTSARHEADLVADTLDAGLTHRDLHPGNVLIPGDGFVVRLIDTGMAHNRFEQTLTGAEDLVAASAAMNSAVQHAHLLAAVITEVIVDLLYDPAYAAGWVSMSDSYRNALWTPEPPEIWNDWHWSKQALHHLVSPSEVTWGRNMVTVSRRAEADRRLLALGKPVAALRALAETTALVHDRLGEHRLGLRLRFRVAQANGQLREFTVQRDILSALLPEQIAVLGSRHFETLETQLDLGIAFAMTGDRRRAVALVDEAARALQDGPGPNNDLTAKATLAAAIVRLPSAVLRAMSAMERVIKPARHDLRALESTSNDDPAAPST
jgi:hypothetical protein